ncbi:multidrug resistance protein SMR [Ammoniphilus oxalaticus]|uniref:Multidrug resistance protein SMR n=1 Tax=Ammoniphilus oxalaticus TaxID=66863 RepID=A0A419SD83_9BACL|nr:multidrug efflux SMR transporter [Ammoniphilus oxalaticus]RKD21082.1 multidrug resistance protein SMR [Ammoniphilus oxalaticus]
MGWLYVFLAAFVEIFWVLGLKYSTNFLMWSGTVITIIFSFYFIIKACALLPSGTVYAVFTGFGAAAIAIIDFTLLGAEFTYGKASFIGLIIIGVVGIQLTTGSSEQEEKQALTGREGS